MAPDRLRFDFAAAEPLSAEDLAAIETAINLQVAADLEVVTYQTGLDEARAAGAMALFGEKYGARVRVVERVRHVECGDKIERIRADLRVP